MLHMLSSDLDIVGGVTTLAVWAAIGFGVLFLLAFIYGALKNNTGIIGSLFNLLILLVRKFWWVLVLMAFGYYFMNTNAF